MATLGDGFVVGDAWHYVLRRYDRDGERLGELRRQIDRSARSAEEIAAERASFADWAERTGNPMPEIPDEWPHFDKFGLDNDGTDRLWVRTHRGEPGITIFDVFAADGYLGEVAVEAEMPRDYASFDAAGDWLAGIHTGPQGETIRLWRIGGG